MALDNLRYGSFRLVAVQAEARALPGYGGQVEDWGTYRFMVEALEMKESQLSENERKKLGGLALRLTERLQGPALQIARSIGVEKHWRQSALGEFGEGSSADSPASSA